jgi:superfamily II DNA or RNA helicase
MIRTRRASVATIMSLPARRPRHPELKLTEAEAEVYAATARLLRDVYREGFRATNEEEEAQDKRRKKARTGRGIYFLECLRLAQRLCSSSPALSSSLAKQGHGELIIPAYRQRFRQVSEMAAAVPVHSKLEELTGLLSRSSDRVVVFSEHLPTIELIAKRVKELGRPAIEFKGDLNRLQRYHALKRFKQEPQGVLISSRSGTEGLNLQFCHQLVNYELPWNPMVVEQRIGRVHRFGQTKDVELYNYAAKGTVEAHILRLLHTKIRLFELVVGELDMILDRVQEENEETLEGLLGDTWLTAETDEDFEVRIEALGEAVVAHRTAAKTQEEQSNSIAAEDPAGRLEREFASLSIPGRLRLGYGTVKMIEAPGVHASRLQQGVHVAEVLEILGSNPRVETDGLHPDFGPTYRLIGVTGGGRAVQLKVQADRLPLVLIELIADPAAPIAA